MQDGAAERRAGEDGVRRRRRGGTLAASEHHPGGARSLRGVCRAHPQLSSLGVRAPPGGDSVINDDDADQCWSMPSIGIGGCCLVLLPPRAHMPDLSNADSTAWSFTAAIATGVTGMIRRMRGTPLRHPLSPPLRRCRHPHPSSTPPSHARRFTAACVSMARGRTRWLWTSPPPSLPSPAWTVLAKARRPRAPPPNPAVPCRVRRAVARTGARRPAVTIGAPRSARKASGARAGWWLRTPSCVTRAWAVQRRATARAAATHMMARARCHGRLRWRKFTETWRHRAAPHAWNRSKQVVLTLDPPAAGPLSGVGTVAVTLTTANPRTFLLYSTSALSSPETFSCDPATLVGQYLDFEVINSKDAADPTTGTLPSPLSTLEGSDTKHPCELSRCSATFLASP